MHKISQMESKSSHFFCIFIHSNSPSPPWPRSASQRSGWGFNPLKAFVTLLSPPLCAFPLVSSKATPTAQGHAHGSGPRPRLTLRLLCSHHGSSVPHASPGPDEPAPGGVSQTSPLKEEDTFPTSASGSSPQLSSCGPLLICRFCEGGFRQNQRPHEPRSSHTPALLHRDHLRDVPLRSSCSSSAPAPPHAD